VVQHTRNFGLTGTDARAPVVVDVRRLDEWIHMVLNPDIEIARVKTPPSALSGELLPGWYEDWVHTTRRSRRR
jgi:hypothetical protein